MKLVFYRGERPNFGDELNLWIWPQLLGPIFDSDPCQQFLGIGSIIGIHNLPPGSTKIVCGAAFVPEYASSPLLDSSWHIYFVRGPRTASLLNLPSELGVGDPGSLVREILLPGKSLPKTHSVGFMPHWVSANTGNWQEVCAQSGVQYIDPRAPLTEVLEKLRTTETIITEAMHGAIVADALDVPWIPVNPLAPRNRAKWRDWSEAMGIKLEMQSPVVSSLQELNIKSVQRQIRLRPRILKSLSMIEDRLINRAASWMLNVARSRPHLSERRTLDAKIDQMLGLCEVMRKTEEV